MSAVRDTTASRTLVGIKARDAGNTLRTVAAAYARDAGNVSRLVFSAFGGGSSLTPNPARVQGYAATGHGATISTNSTTVTPSGGTAPYTYSWTQTSGTSGWSAISPTSATTAFRKTGVLDGDNYTATFTCTVTDAAGNAATSAAVTAYVENFGQVGGTE